MALWWDGCYSAGDGCKYCFFYGLHSKRCGQNEIIRAADEEFYSPLDKQKFESGSTVIPCLSSDFFIPEADEWRKDAWKIIKQRPDLIFRIVTKRIDRFLVSLPNDWGDGYDNVEICCGVENQETADYRLPLFLSYPIKSKSITCMPLIDKVDLSLYLHGVNRVSVGGEWGGEARELNYDWVLAIREQCIDAGVSFNFWRTGQRFRKDGVLYKVSPYSKKKFMRDKNIANINAYVKSDMEKMLAERKIDVIPEDKTFLMAFDRAIYKLGYDFGSAVGSGTAAAPLIINYTKIGTHNSPAARICIRESRIKVKLLFKKITASNFKYIESAPVYIRKIFTSHHDNCESCLKPCRTRTKYAVDGRFIQKNQLLLGRKRC